MTLSTMLIGIGLAALLFLVVQVILSKDRTNLPIKYLQAFTGVLFLFSGWVKAIDPLGTAYKMKDYFVEFESVFEPTWFSFLVPMFTVFKSYIIAFSVGMIVFEIVLGFMILMGIYKKLASYLFFGLVVFFTILTGFTYLTGYVSPDGTFFDFSSWGPFNANNMKVKDCGCFGDFIKLEPKTSFFKDVFLLIPAILFLFTTKRMYTILKPKWALLSSLLVIVGTTIYCFSNYIWDIPHMDFRPFKTGVNILEKRNVELEAAAQVQVTGFVMQHKNDPSRVANVSMADYKNYMDDWKVLEQIRTEPTMKPTKISEFELSDIEGNSSTDEFLESKNKTVVIISKELHGSSSYVNVEVTDTIRVLDTLSNVYRDTVIQRQVEQVDFVATDKFAKSFKDKVVPFANEARKNGYDVQFIVAGAGNDEVKDFAKDVELNATLHTADEILLKTIIRSNPGIMIMDNGVITKKYHISKLPSFDKM